MDEQDFNTFSENQLSTAKNLLFSFTYSNWKTENRKKNKPWPESPVKKGQGWKGMRWGREGIHWACIVCSLEICSSRQSSTLPLHQILPPSLTFPGRTQNGSRFSARNEHKWLLRKVPLHCWHHSQHSAPNPPQRLSRSVHSILGLSHPKLQALPHDASKPVPKPCKHSRFHHIICFPQNQYSLSFLFSCLWQNVWQKQLEERECVLAHD